MIIQTKDLYELLKKQQINVISFDNDTIIFKNITTSEIITCSHTLAALGYKNEVVLLELLCFKLRLL